MPTDNNYNFPKYAYNPATGQVVPLPISPSTGALRIEVVPATGTITPPTGDENAKYDGNYNPVTMVEMPTGEHVMMRMGPDTGYLRVEFN